MPDLLKAVILGLVQGLTEFLPVSSTGHLVILEEALDVSQETFGLTFDAAIHLGTLLALLVYFRSEVARLAVAWLGSLRARRWDRDAESRMAWLILLGTLPAVVIGLSLEGVIEDKLRTPVLVAAMLILFSGVFVLAERLGGQHRTSRELAIRDALAIGFAQAVALVPGVSRSGITISAGLFAGLRREQAAVFAFLLSMPVVAGAGAKKLYDAAEEIREGALGASEIAFFGVGFLVAAASGYLTIRLLLAYLRAHTLYPFVYYRVALGTITLVLVALHIL